MLGYQTKKKRREHWRWEDFFQGRGETMMKFHFIYSKLREKYFYIKTLIGKYQILKSRMPLPPLPTPISARWFLLRIMNLCSHQAVGFSATKM